MYQPTTICLFLNAYKNRHITKYSIHYITQELYKGINLTISRSTLYEWIHLYSNILEYNNYHLASNFVRSKKKSTFISRKITDDIKKYIIDEITKNPVISLKKLRSNILNIFFINLHVKTIYYEIKNSGLTYKSVQYKSYGKSDEEFTKEKNRLKQEILEVNKEFTSIDETSVELYSRPTRGYSKKGQRCIAKKNYKRERYSCIFAINKKGVINYELKRKGIKGDQFRDFINNLVLPHTKDALLMDNATIHKTKTFTEDMKKQNVKLIYNVPYSPQFNPIEYMFNPLKMNMKNEFIGSEKELIAYLDKFCEETKKKGLNGYFNKSLSNLLD